MKKWLQAIVILPGTVLGLIPAVLLISFDFKIKFNLEFVVGITLLIIGLALAIWTMTLFHQIGKGTAAPWNPPKNLVTVGPYRVVRNPMITSVIIMLISEALIFHSTAILLWMILFFMCNEFYFRYFEEPGLIKRFGDEYVQYKNKVGRWIPKI